MTDTTKLLVWKATHGPFSIEDLDEEEIDPNHDYYFQYWVDVMVSDPKDSEAWGELDLWFHTLDEAYKFMNSVNYSVKPYELEMD